jgi:hypothetical protein
MAIFKPVPFEPYGARRKAVRVPRWLTLLLTGIVLGAGGLFYIQERYLPPRLSPSESAALRTNFEQADTERKALKSQLAETSRKLDTALAEKTSTTELLNKERKALEPLRSEIAALVAVLPPDPRGGAVEVRGGQVSTRDGKLDYAVVLTREKAAKPLNAQMKLTLAGEAAKGGESNIAMDPVPVTIGSHEIARGSATLPAGFKPRQATIQVVDGAGKPLGMRVLLVR